MLDDFAQAVTHFDRFLAWAKAKGINPERVREKADLAAELRKRLLATPVLAARPREYTAAELRAAIAARLTPAQQTLAINPLEATAEMRAWATHVVRGAENDRARAQSLFHAICQRGSGQQGGAGRPAHETFEATRQAPGAMSCNEQAELFVAAGRAVGLRAFAVHVERDARGHRNYHDCAIVLLDHENLLVDPAYAWFGVPHQEFVVLDDLQAVARQLLGGAGTGEPGELARLDAGIKLHPDFAWAQIQFARGLTRWEHFARAEQALKEAERLQPGRWDAFGVRGILAAIRGRPEEAESLLREGLAHNPHDSLGHVWLANMLRERGRFAEAREEYRVGLSGPLPSRAAIQARADLAELNEQLAREPIQSDPSP